MAIPDVIEIDGRRYFLASSLHLDERTRVLKHGDSFGVFDPHGDIRRSGVGEHGIFHAGTRFLSRLELSINNVRPLLLNSSVKNDNTLLAIDLTNPLIDAGDYPPIEYATLHIFRARVLWDGACYEHLRLTNYGRSRIVFDMVMAFNADYRDIFEVRGKRRSRRGEHLSPEFEGNSVLLGYCGLDNVVRRTRIVADDAVHSLTAEQVEYRIELDPHCTRDVGLRIEFDRDSSHTASLAYDEVLGQSSLTLKQRRAGDCRVDTSHAQFNGWLHRSQSDVHMLTTYTEQGPYPYAGIPWFSTPFGRDGIITSLEYLWINPEIARGTLNFLAYYQASELNPEQEAEPGKIFHELRKGEMAALNEVPFGCYYGSVDSTPLFVMLAGAYYERTGDLSFIEAIWPQLLAALTWIDDYGDTDGDGFVEYERHNPRGLVHQGWKDSDDSVFHADGRAAQGHIALCEVQGYVYAARRSASLLAERIGDQATAAQLTQQANDLKERFNRAFWCPAISTFAIALDGGKQPCQVRSSNAGHLLFCGIVAEEHVKPTVHTLMSPASFSGWGIRTLCDDEVRYNPMSYHNGSVWPHDNALIAAGLSRYGYKTQALRILSSLFDASLSMDMCRLPELFSGLHRRVDEGPTGYPTACAPQAWAAAAPFLLLQACLGLHFDGARRQINFVRPVLPDPLDELELNDLRIRDASVDIVLRKQADGVNLTLLRKHGDVNVALQV